MATVPKPLPEWYHRRFQAVGRAQARYLLLLLLVSAYTVGLRLTSGEAVSVAVLGLPDIPKAIVNAAATLVLGVLLLALFGTFQAAREAFTELAARLKHDDVTEVAWHQVDEHPNVADFLGYATYVDGKPQKWARPAALVLYPLPVLAVVAWTVTLWCQGIRAPAHEPGWLVWVYRGGSVLVLAVLFGTAVFVRRRWELFRTGK